MISGNTFPRRFTKVDELTRPEHFYLTDEDDCYFIGDYTARQGYDHSATNHLIINFKKRLDRRHLPEWRYKKQAIEKAATAFREALTPDGLDDLTFVPIPPSKAKQHPLYDDRLTCMLKSIRPTPPLDIRELIVQPESTDPVHDDDDRPSPQELEERYQISETLVLPSPNVIAIVDDVLTTGAHFRAVKSLLSVQFPKAEIFGLFIARRVLNSPAI